MTVHDDIFRSSLAELRAEGRYREFADLKRLCGAFPKARLVTPEGERNVTVWCSNDYLAMGQHPLVIGANLTSQPSSFIQPAIWRAEISSERWSV